MAVVGPSFFALPSIAEMPGGFACSQLGGDDDLVGQTCRLSYAAVAAVIKKAMQNYVQIDPRFDSLERIYEN